MSSRRSRGAAPALWDSYRDRTKPPHIGVLLDNTPEYLFWLGAAAISRSVVVGINATYRGAELARLIDHCECQVLVTSDTYTGVLADAPSGVPADRVFETHTERYAELLGAADVDRTWEPPTSDDLFLLIFTSGSTGFPKAVRCTQGRFATTGRGAAAIGASVPAKPCTRRCPCSTAARCSPGSPARSTRRCRSGRARRFSASRHHVRHPPDGATMLAYTGKVLNYILAVPPSPDDASSPLSSRSATRRPRPTSARSPRGSTARCATATARPRDSSSSAATPSMPAGALGTADDNIAVYDPETGEECPRARFDADGRLMNAAEAVGEIVNTDPRDHVRGLLQQRGGARVSKVRGGIYWSGDLAYRDDDGWFYFAGRSNEWFRVDGENFAAAPVERIVARHPHVRSVAVYAVPDEPVGDRVMVAVEVDDVDAVRHRGVRRVPRAQPDLGTKWVPSFVRVSAELPKLASMKLDKTSLRREAWRAPDTWWRPARGERLRRMSSADIESQAHLLR